MTDITPPDDLPSYLESSIDNYDADPAVLRAVRDYAADLKAAAEAGDGPTADEIYAQNTDGEIGEIKPGTDEWTYVIKKVKCGDDSCKCASGSDADMHGPYVYRVRRDGDDLEWEYVGKHLSTDDPAVDAAVDTADAPDPAADD